LILVCLRPALKTHTAGPLPIASIANASSQAQQRKYRDPYALAQSRQRKAANLKRQEELKKEREEALGDPVRGVTTPFVESFDTATPSATLGVKSKEGEEGSTKGSEAAAGIPLNHFVKPSELEQAIEHSYILAQPLVTKNPDLRDPAQEAEEIRRHAEAHERATAAVARILSLANGNQKDRTRFNIQRCIETFGRHNTDSFLTQRAPSNQPRAADKTPLADKTPRAGPDTGSSEVQIAILTAKIRALANHLERPHCQKDKVNKRNLRVLVHRRQKLLTYLRRKERGSERWQNVVQTLGLTDGTWKGEISL
jgi:ribosomal protein S15